MDDAVDVVVDDGWVWKSELSDKLPARQDYPRPVDAWLAQVSQRTGSTRTPATYLRYVMKFMKPINDPRLATSADCHAFGYQASPGGDAPSASTVVVRLAALRSFFDFLRRMKYVTVNPVDDVIRPRMQASEPRGLDVDDLRRLLAATPNKPAGQRDRAVILSFVLTGLRRSELLGLRRKDLTINGHVSYTVRVKGGDVRRRELPAPAFNVIVEALEALGTPLETLGPDDRILPISEDGFFGNLKRYAKKA
ncbi:MAG: tyrosine-type recombinase/integrase, partial [Verrucomicrobia bacterium]|nr:tyrosine-type recombinase/integrase [Verrucomicrobiota bacterium]